MARDEQQSQGDDAFDPGVQGGGGQNWLGYSRGIIADTSKAIAIEAGGNFIEAAAKAADKFIELKSAEEVRTEVDAVQGKYSTEYMNRLGYTQGGTGDGGWQTTVTPEGGAPEEIVREAQRMEAMKNAVSQGSIKDSYYWMQLDANAKYMKNKYPGHKDHIDSLFAKLTGSIPANRVIGELQEEYKKGINPQTKAYDTLLKDMSNDKYNYLGVGGLPPDLEVRAQQGRPYTTTELLRWRSDITAKDSAIQASSHKTSMAIQAGTLNKEDARQSAVKHLGNTMHVLQTSMTGGFAGSFDDMARKARDMGDKPFSAEDTLKITQALGQQRAAWIQQVDSVLYGPQKGAPGQPDWRYADYVDTAEVSKIKDQYVKRFDDLHSYLTDKNYGALNMLSNHLENVQKGVELEVYRSSEVFAKLAAVHKVAGKDFMAAVASSAGAPDIQTSMANSYKNMLMDLRLWAPGVTDKDRAGLPRPPARSFNELYERNKQDQAGKEGYAYFLNKGVSLMADPQSDKETFKAYAEGMYGERNVDFLNKINKDQRGEVLLKIAGNPQIFNRLKREEPELYKKYTTWVEGSLQGVLQDHASTINDARSNPDVDIRYNPNTNAFVAVSRTNTAVDAALNKSIQQVNAAIQGVKPMYQDQGKDINKSLDRFVRGLSITVGAKKETAGDVLKREALADDPLGMRGSPRAMPVPTVRTVAPLLDLIHRGETGAAGISSYNVAYGGKGKPLEVIPDMTKMTLQDVYNHQEAMEAEGRGSTAIGRYQFLNWTLGRIANKMGLDPRTAVFDEQTQDAIAFELMKERGLERYMSGRMKRDDFVNELAKEWAAIPTTTTGKSHYEGVAGNKARIKAEDMVKTLDSMRPKGIKDPEGR